MGGNRQYTKHQERRPRAPRVPLMERIRILEEERCHCNISPRGRLKTTIFHDDGLSQKTCCGAVSLALRTSRRHVQLVTIWNRTNQPTHFGIPFAYEISPLHIYKHKINHQDEWAAGRVKWYPIDEPRKRKGIQIPTRVLCEQLERQKETQATTKSIYIYFLPRSVSFMMYFVDSWNNVMSPVYCFDPFRRFGSLVEPGEHTLN